MNARCGTCDCLTPLPASRCTYCGEHLAAPTQSLFTPIMDPANANVDAEIIARFERLEEKLDQVLERFGCLKSFTNL